MSDSTTAFFLVFLGFACCRGGSQRIKKTTVKAVSHPPIHASDRHLERNKTMFQLTGSSESESVGATCFFFSFLPALSFFFFSALFFARSFWLGVGTQERAKGGHRGGNHIRASQTEHNTKTHSRIWPVQFALVKAKLTMI